MMMSKRETQMNALLSSVAVGVTACCTVWIRIDMRGIMDSNGSCINKSPGL